MIFERLSLTGRAILVSGAGGGGIGSAICEAIAEAGGDVAGFDLELAALEASRRRVERLGRRFVAIRGDATTPEGARSAVEAALRELRALHGLVNVVGGGPLAVWASLLDYDPAEFDRSLALNLKSALLMSQATARALVASGIRGSIVCTASISGLGASPYHAAYGAAKAALCQLAKTMAVEWGPQGIRVNVIAPGTITTPRATTSADPERDRAAIPLGRRGDPAEIAGAALFLLSDLSSYVTGQTLVVDGGATAKFAFLGPDDLPVFMEHPEILERLGFTNAGGKRR
jgi:NAD(P)-dependent dehydrogenase (short-subunit alcohol dehydrogenase family)